MANLNDPRLRNITLPKIINDPRLRNAQQRLQILKQRQLQTQQLSNEAQKFDSQISQIKSGNINDILNFYNSIPTEIQNKMNITPAQIKAKQTNLINQIQQRIQEYQKIADNQGRNGNSQQEQNYIDRADAFKQALIRVQKGELFSINQISNYAYNVVSQTQAQAQRYKAQVQAKQQQELQIAKMITNKQPITSINYDKQQAIIGGKLVNLNQQQIKNLQLTAVTQAQTQSKNKQIMGDIQSKILLNKPLNEQDFTKAKAIGISNQDLLSFARNVANITGKQKQQANNNLQKVVNNVLGGLSSLYTPEQKKSIYNSFAQTSLSSEKLLGKLNTIDQKTNLTPFQKEDMKRQIVGIKPNDFEQLKTPKQAIISIEATSTEKLLKNKLSLTPNDKQQISNFYKKQYDLKNIQPSIVQKILNVVELSIPFAKHILNTNNLNNVQKASIYNAISDIKKNPSSIITNDKNMFLKVIKKNPMSNTLGFLSDMEKSHIINKSETNNLLKIVLSPVNYGKNLVVRYQAGQNPILDDFKSGTKFQLGVGKKLFKLISSTATTLYDGFKALYGIKGISNKDGLIASSTRNVFKYYQTLIKTATNKGGNQVINKITNDTKKLLTESKAFEYKLGKGIVDTTIFVKNNPELATFLITLAISKRLKSSVDSIIKNPESTLANAIFFLFPNEWIIKGLQSINDLRLTTESILFSSKELKTLDEQINTIEELKSLTREDKKNLKLLRLAKETNQKLSIAAVDLGLIEPKYKAGKITSEEVKKELSKQEIKIKKFKKTKKKLLKEIPRILNENKKKKKSIKILKMPFKEKKIINDNLKKLDESLYSLKKKEFMSIERDKEDVQKRLDKEIKIINDFKENLKILNEKIYNLKTSREIKDYLRKIGESIKLYTQYPKASEQLIILNSRIKKIDKSIGKEKALLNPKYKKALKLYNDLLFFPYYKISKLNLILKKVTEFNKSGNLLKDERKLILIKEKIIIEKNRLTKEEINNLFLKPKTIQINIIDKRINELKKLKSYTFDKENIIYIENNLKKLYDMKNSINANEILPINQKLFEKHYNKYINEIKDKPKKIQFIDNKLIIKEKDFSIEFEYIGFNNKDLRDSKKGFRQKFESPIKMKLKMNNPINRNIDKQFLEKYGKDVQKKFKSDYKTDNRKIDYVKKEIIPFKTEKLDTKTKIELENIESNINKLEEKVEEKILLKSQLKLLNILKSILSIKQILQLQNQLKIQHKLKSIHQLKHVPIIDIKPILKDIEKLKKQIKKPIKKPMIKSKKEIKFQKKLPTVPLKLKKSKLIKQIKPQIPPPNKIKKIKIQIHLPIFKKNVKREVLIYEALYRRRRNFNLPYNKNTNPIIEKKLQLTTTYNRALKKILNIADNSSVRSVEVRIIGKTGKIIKDIGPPNNLYKFGFKKPNSHVLKLVEKTPYIRDTIGEKREISRHKNIIKSKSNKKNKKYITKSIKIKKITKKNKNKK